MENPSRLAFFAHNRPTTRFKSPTHPKAPISQSFKFAQVPAQIPPFPALLPPKNRKGRA